MEELKPCPFCGAEAEKWFNFRRDCFCAIITCRKCHIYKEETVSLEFGQSSVNPSISFNKAEEKVVEKWNQRDGKS